MTGKNVQYKILNESSIILSCFAAFQRHLKCIFVLFKQLTQSLRVALAQRLSPLTYAFYFGLALFKDNFVSRYIAHSFLTNLHISHTMKTSAVPPPPALFSAKENSAPD